MQGILQYPEFLAVAVLSFLLLFKRSSASVAERSSAPPNLLPMAYGKWISKYLVWAGRRDNDAFANFLKAKVLLSLFALPAAVWLGFVGLLSVAPLFFAPDVHLFIFVKRRQQSIKESLPQALDLLVMCVDAGLGLEAALQRVGSDSSAVSEALQEELSILSRDILLGLDRSVAYKDMYERTGVDELKLLGSALNQATKMGLSISRMLRGQADFVRQQLSQKAEARAAKVPVWMAFPMWFCVMPALFILTVAPAFISFLMQSGHVRPEWFH